MKTAQQTQHTPQLSYDGQGVIMSGHPGKKTVVARLEGDGIPLAPLFASAPELLEALENCLCYLEYDSDDEQEREDYAKARAAIAKATGQ